MEHNLATKVDIIKLENKVTNLDKKIESLGDKLTIKFGYMLFIAVGLIIGVLGLLIKS